MATPLLKRFVCGECGSFGPMPGDPYLRCASCRVIGDFDLGIARRHPLWPRHEALFHELHGQAQRALGAAIASGDPAAWLACYRPILSALVTQCPGVYPAAAADPGYREHLVEFLAQHHATLVFEPALLASQRRTNELMHAAYGPDGRLRTERLWPVFDHAVTHFELQDRICNARPPGPPPGFARSFMRRLGISMMVQEWLPRLELADQRALVGRLGLTHEYLEAGSDPTGRCGGCGAALPTQDGATVACADCARTVDLARGGFGCRTCGVVVYVLAGIEEVSCPYCSAHLRESRAGLVDRQEAAQTFAFIASELALLLRQTQGTLAGLEALDGPVRRKGKPWRMVTLRARLAAGTLHDFFESTDHETGPGPVAALSWLEVQGTTRGLPTVHRAYREHPRCHKPPRDAAELARRLGALAPSATVADLVLVPHGDGVVLELREGEARARLVYDPHGRSTAVCQAWLAGA